MMKKFLILLLLCLLPVAAFADVTLVAENDRLELHYDTVESQIILKDKLTQEEWRSTPDDIDQDKRATGVNKINRQSDLIVQYHNTAYVTNQVNSYTGAIKKGDFTWELIENGVAIRYYFPKQGFVIPVQYVLEEDCLAASIVSEGIEEEVWEDPDTALEKKQTVMSVSLLPFMGAAGSDDEGYLIIPDGSGALIHFNNGRTGAAIYQQDVYGRDDALTIRKAATTTYDVNMPLFGIVRNGRALMAVVENGAYQAQLNAMVNGQLTGYSNAYFAAQYIHMEANTIMPGSEHSTDVMLPTNTFRGMGNFTVRPVYRQPARSNSSRLAQFVKKVIYSVTVDCRRQTVNRKSATCAAIFALFRQKKLPYTEERPGAQRPVTECSLSKKCLQHFFDTLRQPARSNSSRLAYQKNGSSGGCAMFMKKCLIVFCAALLMMLQCCMAGASELKEDPDMLLTNERTWDIRKAQYTIFAKPPVGWVGDVMPMVGDEESGELRLFYLQDWRDGAPTYHPFHSFTTSDFVHYTYNGEDIPVTATNHYDMALGTGSVTKVGDTYHAFYTGNNPHFYNQGKPREYIRHAVSTDGLQSFTKMEDETFTMDQEDGYNRHDFRDPYLFWNEEGQEWWLLITAVKDNRGVIARYRSQDMSTWEKMEPLCDIRGGIMECPDLFKWGDYWYLVYSTDWTTR